MKKPILFIDFNGVISYKPFWFSLQDKDHELHDIGNRIEEYLFSIDRSIVKEWMMGGYSSEEVHTILKENISPPFDYDKVYKIFVDDCKKLDISKRILDRLTELKSNYTLVLMTDNMDCFDRFTLPANPRLQEVFDEINNSYNSRCSKRDNGCAVFKTFIQKNKVESLEHIFLDDAEKNCAAFKEHISGRAIQVRSEDEVLEALNTL